ncbi:MAG: ATP-binding protein [Ferruginibacter sp.]
MLFAFSGKSQKKTAGYTDFDHGYFFFFYKKWDSAFLMFNRYINDTDDTLKKAKAYSFLGEILWNTGDLYGAQQSLTDAIKTLDPGNDKHYEEMGYTYNLLGNVSLDLKQYDEAIGFYNNAIPFFKGADYVFEVMNGKATALQRMKNYKNAILLYDSMLALKPLNQLLVARIIDNIARTKWLSDPAYPAAAQFHSALKIRTDSQNIRGLNASYAHLADYYVKLKPDSALYYAQKMLEKAKENQSPDDILEAYDKLIRFSNAADLKEYWYSEFKQLSDSLQLSRDTTRNRFALIRYDVEKNKADNLVLRFEVEKRKVDNLELQQDNTRQRLWKYGVIMVALIVTSGLWIRYDKRRKRIKQEAENAIKDSKLKTSQKVHDVVANGLYTVMNELEHSKTIERESIVNKIEVLYEKSRNISYEDAPSGNTTAYNNQVHHLLKTFSTDQTKVLVVGNQPPFWNRITGSQKIELELVLNEIMINMKKHSHAKNVSVIFKQEEGIALITYKDDGVGFPPGYTIGNGLKNTVSRIKSINGKVNFGKNEKAGVFIEISFPLEPDKI